MRDWISLRLTLTSGAAAVLVGFFLAGLLTPPEHRFASVLSGTVGGLAVSYFVAVGTTWKSPARGLSSAGPVEVSFQLRSEGARS
jgi:hypothetical protein